MFGHRLADMLKDAQQFPTLVGRMLAIGQQHRKRLTVDEFHAEEGPSIGELCALHVAARLVQLTKSMVRQRPDHEVESFGRVGGATSLDTSCQVDRTLPRGCAGRLKRR